MKRSIVLGFHTILVRLDIQTGPGETPQTAKVTFSSHTGSIRHSDEILLVFSDDVDGKFSSHTGSIRHSD